MSSTMSSSIFTNFVFVVVLAPPFFAFAFTTGTSSQLMGAAARGTGTHAAPDLSSSTCLQVHSHCRREAMDNMAKIAAAGIAGLTTTPACASAKDELFKPNPLTNPLLERIRILDQDYADNIKYGGELAPGSPKGREAYAKLLVPILSIQRDLDAVNDLVREDNKEIGLAKADDILNKPEFQKLNFKKIFNAFADNIYYSDPDRANAYLGGGAVPKNEQSIAYLLRNDILTNLEALQAEVTYLIKENKKIASGEVTGPLEIDDLYEYAKNSSESMKKYLNLVPPAELELGRTYFASIQKS